jgi:hypothetical protein
VLTFLECVVTYFCFECVVTYFYFECVVTFVTDRFDNPFLYKRPNSTSVKLFFSVSAQPQLLEIESLENVGIVGRTPLYLMFLFNLFFFSLCFSCYIFVENELNYFPLSLHLNIKFQINFYISILNSLQSYII